MEKIKKLYEIQIDEEGVFLERPNRFIAHVRLDSGSEEIVHVHDSGRIKELLYEGNRVKLRRATNPNRKTKWDMISGRASDGEDILINSSFHRYISENLLNDFEISPLGKIDKLKAEVKYGKSRLDYLLEKDGRKIWVEVKGVSLAEDRVAMFPDAPSERAVKHLKELIELKEGGDRAAVILLVFRNSDSFRPRYETDPKFNEYFYKAISMGVEIYPIQLSLDNGIINYKGTIEIMGKIKN
ncbi:MULTISPECIES: DNA/RNA nuclease SfsA [Psychrilyobacter]|uniref:Sugar fermentation stimulation protein homolog n=1 Tax=Psychrilyobacter piezotolerans TaxID=2293438 RepID=A0ABX9KKH5_9FUSO|nr:MULTISPECIES: DNA/RNA nuclease SfsA [Psychrilyobacter]MCS5421863.1 DNA/RNA nuclease SfsA [Psychrilyobacter sp. S5]NDI76754.1 DNA/RNA nuclease SfsA [Psychrilyobacter piezotolerans]RDE65372.1 DNA/RNA nuclease SfsA [Psychrilyobacter sp. S5]REI42990.1 DNA/RNA nuclease SfsA [Psychrilyobacter piezotolerans]